MLHQTDKTLKAVIFSSGRLLHPPSTVLPICLWTARARPTKSSGQSLFGTKIVPTTSELYLTGSIYYRSAVTMYLANLALFFRFKKYRFLQNRDMWGDQNIAILTLKTGLLSVFFTEKRYKSINIVFINNKISNTIPLRVCLISELRYLTRIFAVR